MIETENLKLVPCELEHFEALINNAEQIEQMLQVSLAKDWNSFPEAIPFGYKYLQENPDALGWWTYLFIHTADKKLVGSGGFKGKADRSGMVEIGYEIAPEYRGRGLATEAARGLIEYAFSHSHVQMVDAHTLAETNPSTKVLKKIRMQNIETIVDPDDGKLWHWRLLRLDYKN